MPLLKLQTSVSLSAEQQDSLLAALSRSVADCIGKPENYVMVTLESGPVMMAGKAGNAAFADVRSIGGLNGKVNRELAQRVCALLQESLGIPPERVYLNFTSLSADHWGWKGGTFG